MRKQLISFVQVIKFLQHIKLKEEINPKSPLAYTLGTKGLQKVVRWFLDTDDNPDSYQNLIITFWSIHNVP